MTNFIIKNQSEWSFDRAGVKGKVFHHDVISNLGSFLFIETDGGHDTVIRQKECNFIYKIIDGSGVFTIENNDYECSEGDFVFIPKGNKFNYRGKLRMHLTSIPAWFSEQEEVVN